MAAISKNAYVDFQKGSIIVQDGPHSRVTIYNSRTAEDQMLVHIVALKSLGFNFSFQNEVANMHQKLVKLEQSIALDALAKIISTLSMN